MIRHSLRFALPILLMVAGPTVGAERALEVRDDFVIAHDLTVELLPAERRMAVEDVVSLPTPPPSHAPVPFLLHAGLEVESADSEWIVEAHEDAGMSTPPLAFTREMHAAGVPLRMYQLRPASGSWPRDPRPRLRFSTGTAPPREAGEASDPVFPSGRGSLSEAGVVLDGSTYWIPWFGPELLRFRLSVSLPAGWEAVSQGTRTLHEIHENGRRVRWECSDPMEEAFLIAAPFTEYSTVTGGITSYAFLREPDPELAHRYIDATAEYIDRYSRMIGPYPYEKFALVENFQETGYGMPSFTLLGSTVIRLPFIVHTSYPHEILHNWWGNSVYVDRDRGNWCEGLTSYLADHLMSERQGRGIEYRRDSLLRYRGFVSEQEDFPLTEFRSRDSLVRQAIGYEKGLMFWHMLRLRLGDAKFIDGLRLLYQRFRWQRASFDDLEAVFAEVSGEDLGLFFDQWVRRSGVPVLSLQSAGLGDRRVRVTIRQSQDAAPHALRVPAAFTLEDETQARVVSLTITDRISTFEFVFPKRVLRVDLDPYFDVLRRLDRKEAPASLADLFGASRVTLVLPERGSAAVLEAWAAFAEAWSRGADAEVASIQEAELRELPEDGAVWVLGSDNRWSRALADGLGKRGAEPGEEEVRVAGKRFSKAAHGFAFAVSHPRNPAWALGWVSAESPAAIAALARKLRHYSKYSYLVFSGDEATNVLKGQWEVLESPLINALVETERGAPAALAPRPVPRADLPRRGALQ